MMGRETKERKRQKDKDRETESEIFYVSLLQLYPKFRGLMPAWKHLAWLLVVLAAKP